MVEQDFREMNAPGANVVRVHLQSGKFMGAPDRPNGANLARLEKLVRLAEDVGLYHDLTGPGCSRKKAMMTVAAEVTNEPSSGYAQP
jgi:hypothetical protein